jgi:hypothetical protein
VLPYELCAEDFAMFVDQLEPMLPAAWAAKSLTAVLGSFPCEDGDLARRLLDRGIGLLREDPAMCQFV